MGKLSKVLASLCMVALMLTAAIPGLAADGFRPQVCWTNCPGPGFDS